MSSDKPLPITKVMVWKAYQQVKRNGQAAGVDGQSLDDFNKDLENNLYKLWNRMASGSYLPPPVRRVEIPKSGGGIRPLGIPTVADRIAQMVVKQVLEPQLEPIFDQDSYGYRPGKSAHQAVESCRQRCWRSNWVLDLDIKGVFDAIDHDLLMRAVKTHTSERWVVLYLQRWLQAPFCYRMARSSPGREAHRKVASSAHCWPICSCTMRLMRGCAGLIRPLRLSATQMM